MLARFRLSRPIADGRVGASMPNANFVAEVTLRVPRASIALMPSMMGRLAVDDGAAEPRPGTPFPFKRLDATVPTIIPNRSQEGPC